MDKNQAVNFVIGLLSGAVVGAGIAVLLAPQSGADVRQSMSDKVNEIVEAGRQARAARRQELESQYREAIRIPLTLEQDADAKD